MANSSKLPLATCTGQITVIKNGEKGEQGATERFRDYGDIPAYESIQCGGNGDKYIDYVVYNSDWYLCIKNHAKDSRNYPPQNTTYWQKVSEQKRIATKLFLATKAYIKNLMVNDILVTDNGASDGNKLLVANKDGITCNQGTFKNVTVTGTLNATAGSFGDLKVGSVSYNDGSAWKGMVTQTTWSNGEFRNDLKIGSGVMYNYLQYTSSSGYIDQSGVSIRNATAAYNKGMVHAVSNKNLYGTTSGSYIVGFSADLTANNNSDSLVGLYVSAKSASGKNCTERYALYADDGDVCLKKGLFRGMRVNTRVVTSNTTLTDDDNVIVCTNSGDITITFPSSPRKGQMYIVIQTGGNIYFSGNGKVFRGRLSGGTVNSKTGGQITFFFWDGSYWSCSYAN